MDKKTITELAGALQRGEQARALRCVARLEEVEFCDPSSGLRALHYAVRYGGLKSCEALLKRGADVRRRCWATAR